jgi:hypothetical protein
MALTMLSKTNFGFKSRKQTVILITFLDNEGIIRKEFVPLSQMVSKKYFFEILSRLVQRNSRVKSSAS